VGVDDRYVRRLTITNAKGLHARAAAKFVGVAGRFEAEITVERDGTIVDGRSIMGLLLLAAGPGTSIELRARGTDACEALDALTRLVAAGFHET